MAVNWLRFFAGMVLGLWCWLAHAQLLSRLVVPFPAGGSLDRVARMLAPELSARTGRHYVVENRPGADGALALEYLLKQPAQDRALLMVNPAVTTGQVNGAFKVDLSQALRPVIQVGETDRWLVARSDLPWSDVSALLKGLRQGQLRISCAGPPGPMLQACEFLSRTFADQVVVAPFKGEAPALQALLGGHVDLMFVTQSAAFDLVQGGRIRWMGTAAGRRAQAALEQVPKLQSILPGLDLLAGYIGVFAPATASDDEVAQVNRIINTALRSDSMIQMLQSAHISPVGGAASVMREAFLQDLHHQEKGQKASVRK